ncbi:MAG: prepilin peptidase [Candidatus Subteraquimicrobiales bacterium]|nr:prepilin peptidase [Candidatus Subteraquimicrobiales bacterium]
MLIFYIFIFLFGLIIGSFLNVVIFRLESGEQVVSGRSHCRRCNHVLAWYDLFPIFSFLVLGGRCRYCRKKLSLQYPLVEIATAILFVLSLMVIRQSAESVAISNLIQSGEIASSLPLLAMTIGTFLFYLFIISALIIIFVYDLRHYIIPDKIVYLAIVTSLIYLLFRTLDFGIWNFIGHWDLGFGISNTFFNGLFASVLASGFFLAIVLLTRGEGMGGGDVKLAFLMGLVLGWPKVLVALFLAFTLGAICGIIFVIAKKKALKSAIPFGPFLVLGTVIGIMWGNEIIKWYFGYLF